LRYIGSKTCAKVPSFHNKRHIYIALLIFDGHPGLGSHGEFGFKSFCGLLDETRLHNESYYLVEVWRKLLFFGTSNRQS
jgi:hypothetical protein